MHTHPVPAEPAQPDHGADQSDEVAPHAHPVSVDTTPRRSVWFAEAALVRATGVLGPASARAALLDAAINHQLDGAGLGPVSVYLSAPCDQACPFCTWGHARGRAAYRSISHLSTSLRLDAVGSGSLALLLQRIARRPSAGHLRITGNDWCAHPRVLELLDLVDDAGLTRVEFEGPSTRLAHADLAARVARISATKLVILSRHAATSDAHDRIVGLPGAGRDVERAIELMTRLGVAVQVNTLLTIEGLRALPELARWARARGVSWALLGWAPDRRLGGWDGLFEVPRLDVVRGALVRLSPDDMPAEVTPAMLPACALPEHIRARMPRGDGLGPTSGRRANAFGPACAQCAYRAGCVGVSREYERQHGLSELRPIPREPR